MKKIERVVIELVDEQEKVREYKRNIFEQRCLEPLVRMIIVDTTVPTERVLSMTNELMARAANAEIIRQELLRKYFSDDLEKIINFNIDMSRDALVVCREIESEV